MDIFFLFIFVTTSLALSNYEVDDNFCSPSKIYVQLECFPATYTGCREGFVRSRVICGQPIPLSETFVYKDEYAPGIEVAFYYEWQTPYGTISNVPMLMYAPEGIYTLKVTDFAGNWNTSSCYVSSITNKTDPSIN